MNALTKFFLILLRLAIGWHLLFAGLEKFEPGYKGSEGYLLNSGGPLAPKFHELAGDRLADKLAAQDARDRAFARDKSLPPALQNEWDAYYAAFVAHYGLTADQQDKAKKEMDAIK